MTAGPVHPGRCSACGLAGGQLAPATYDDLPVPVRDAFRGLPVEQGYVCGGPLFADDGPAACLRRMAGKQHRAYTEPS